MLGGLEMRTQVHVGGKQLLMIATVCALLLTLIVRSQHSTKNDVEKIKYHDYMLNSELFSDE